MNTQAEGSAKIIDCYSRGLTVVNAARPMSGDEYWEGKFISGVFYVAGDLVRWQKHWLAYGAVRLQPITNQEILQAVIDKAKTHRYGSMLRGLVEKRGLSAIQELASNWLNMPFSVEHGVDLESVEWP